LYQPVAAAERLPSSSGGHRRWRARDPGADRARAPAVRLHRLRRRRDRDRSNSGTSDLCPGRDLDPLPRPDQARTRWTICSSA